MLYNHVAFLNEKQIEKAISLQCLIKMFLDRSEERRSQVDFTYLTIPSLLSIGKKMVQDFLTYVFH